MKGNPTILDATAANRCMWATKESPFIEWIDIEEDLEYKPDRILDCTNTDYPDKHFKAIFFDPPHSYGREKNSGIFTTPSKAVSDEKWPEWKRKHPRYYGLDKYPTKEALLGFINRAQKEFLRILQDDGMLWLKWSENHSSLNAILPLFRDWNIMINIPAFTRRKTSTPTYWVMLMKNAEYMTKADEPRLHLSESTNNEGSE